MQLLKSNPKIKFSILKIIKLIGKFFAFLIFLYGLITAITGLINYAKPTFFEREAIYENLKKIDTGANSEYVDTLFGKPFLIRQLPKFELNFKDGKYVEEETGLNNLVERIYRDRNFYLQTISDSKNQIIVYSIVVRGSNFTPAIPLELYSAVQTNNGSYAVDKNGVPVAQKNVADLKIGKSTFGDLKNETAQKIGFESPSQHTFYLEHYYFGRPGGYKNFLFGISPYGYHWKNSLYEEMSGIAFAFEEGKNITNNTNYKSWRNQDRINAFGVFYTEDQKIEEDLINYFFKNGIGPTADIIYNLNANNF